MKRSLYIIVVAALLVELTSAGLYYSARQIIEDTNERLVTQEMRGIAMDIRKHLAKVEVVINNYAWVVGGDVEEPEWMFETSHNLVENNPFLFGCGIAFVADYYPQIGRLFEPYSVRRADGRIETLQLASPSHDYTRHESYIFTMEHDSDHWSEPYIDNDGAKAFVTTYSTPAHDTNDNIVAVVAADISLEWLDSLVGITKTVTNTKTQRFLVSSQYNLLAGDEGPFYESALEVLKKQNQNGNDEGGHMTMEDERGAKWHLFYYPVGGITGWTLLCICSDREISAPLRKVFLFLLLPVLGGFLLLGFIVWRTSRNLERLRKVNAEKERIDSELRVASEIQSSMLPKAECKAAGAGWEVELCGSLVPAREVGGDIFDYYIRDEKLFFCIGDVSGKGTPSAMVMGVTHALFRAASAHESNPAHILHTLNTVTCEGNESNMFVTLFIGVLDLPTGRLCYCDAGHDGPIVIEHPESKVGNWQPRPHLPLGLFEDVVFEVEEAALRPGTTLFLYTDGLTEAKDIARRQFGLARVQGVLRRCVGQEPSPRAIVAAMSREVRQFVGDAPQSDDQTMLAIHYRRQAVECTFSETLTLKNHLPEIQRLSAFMASVTTTLGIGKPLAGQLRLALEEAVVNVIQYAYPPDTEADISVTVTSDGHSLCFQIVDTGAPFDPTAQEAVDTSLPVESRPVGGLGIHLIRQLMDTINYERTNGKNILTLRKSNSTISRPTQPGQEKQKKKINRQQSAAPGGRNQTNQNKSNK